MSLQKIPLTHLGDDMPVDVFLRDYWQQKPLLIRNALPALDTIITANEIAGFALEDDVVSRLIVQTPSHTKEELSHWDVTFGPLPEKVFEQLPEKFWTLLVQHCDQLDTNINALLNYFKFLPQWRLDDVMVNYSVDGGGVGPHFDYYDVFLLQGCGKKRWRIGQKCDQNTELDSNAPMKVLTRFETVSDWEVNTGDMLYIPPNYAHWGEAIGESITYSIGFRAPSHQDILLDYFQETASSLTQDKRYEDTLNGLAQTNTSEISANAIESIQHIIQSYGNNKDAIAAWFGNYISTPNPGAVAQHDLMIEVDEDFVGKQVKLNRFVKSAYYVGKHQTLLFINGQRFECSESMAKKISSYSVINPDEITDKLRPLFDNLAECGYLELCQ